MGNFRACLLVGIVSACGGGSDTPDAAIKFPDAAADAYVFKDAPPPSFDLSCSSKPAPTTATATVTLSGTVKQIQYNGSIAIAAIGNADVDACKAGTACMDNDRLATVMSDHTTGNFSLGPLTTSSVPLDAYVYMHKTGVRSNYVFPPEPLVADVPAIPMLTFSDLLLQTICGQNDAGAGVVIVAVRDCADMPITDSANIALVVKQGGTVVTSTTVIDLSMLNQEGAGTFLVCNVPQNASTSLSATYNGMSLRGHDVRVVSAATTSTIIRPGYL